MFVQAACLFPLVHWVGKKAARTRLRKADSDGDGPQLHGRGCHLLRQHSLSCPEPATYGSIVAALDTGSQYIAASMEIDILLTTVCISFSIGLVSATLSRWVVPYFGSEANRCQSVIRGKFRSVFSPVFEVQRSCAAFEN